MPLSAPATGLTLVRVLQSTMTAVKAKHESNQQQVAALEDVFRLMGSFDTKPAASDMASPIPCNPSCTAVHFMDHKVCMLS